MLVHWVGMATAAGHGHCSWAWPLQLGMAIAAEGHVHVRMMDSCKLPALQTGYGERLIILYINTHHILYYS